MNSDEKGGVELKHLNDEKDIEKPSKYGRLSFADSDNSSVRVHVPDNFQSNDLALFRQESEPIHAPRTGSVFIRGQANNRLAMFHPSSLEQSERQWMVDRAKTSPMEDDEVALYDIETTSHKNVMTGPQKRKLKRNKTKAQELLRKAALSARTAVRLTSKDHNNNHMTNEHLSFLRAPIPKKKTHDNADVNYLNNECHADRIRVASVFVKDAMNGRSHQHITFDEEGKISEKPLKVWTYITDSRYVSLRIWISIIHMFIVLIENRGALLDHESNYTSSYVNKYYIEPVSHVAAISIDLFFVILYIVDWCLVYYSVGEFFYKKQNEHGTGYMKAKAILIIFSLVDITVSYILLLFGIETQYRMVRFFRAFFLVMNDPLIRVGASLVLNSGLRIWRILMLVGLHVIFFATLGYILMSGIAENTYFATLDDSVMSLFILLTTANYPDVMLPAYREHRVYALFFLVYLVVGLIFLMNVVLAMMYKTYDFHNHDEIIFVVNRVENALKDAYELVLDRENNKFGFDSEAWISLCSHVKPEMSHSTAMAIWMMMDDNNDNELSLDEFLELCKYFVVEIEEQILSADDDPPPKKHDWMVIRYMTIIQLHVYNFISYKVRCGKDETGHPNELKIMETFVDFVVVVNTITVIMQEWSGDESSLREDLQGVSTGFLYVYVVEMILKHIGLGISKYWDNPMNRLEGIITLLSLFFEIFKSGSGGVIAIIRIVRLLRMVRNVVRSQQLRIIFSVAYRVVGNASRSLLGVLWCLFYIYAILGMNLFGGRITLGEISPPETEVAYPNVPHTSLYHINNYYVNNWDDFMSSIITEWELLIVNNWFIIMSGTEHLSKGNRLYFVSFFLVINVVIMNLVIAFLLDAFLYEHDRLTKILLKQIALRESRDQLIAFVKEKLANGEELSQEELNILQNDGTRMTIDDQDWFAEIRKARADMETSSNSKSRVILKIKAPEENIQIAKESDVNNRYNFIKRTE